MFRGIFILFIFFACIEINCLKILTSTPKFNYTSDDKTISSAITSDNKYLYIANG